MHLETYSPIIFLIIPHYHTTCHTHCASFVHAHQRRIPGARTPTTAHHTPIHHPACYSVMITFHIAHLELIFDSAYLHLVIVTCKVLPYITFFLQSKQVLCIAMIPSVSWYAVRISMTQRPTIPHNTNSYN